MGGRGGSSRKRGGGGGGGEATEDNFYLGTEAEFEYITGEKREDIINSKPDYISNSGSRYYYRDGGVYRQSDHWGTGIASCDWQLKGHTTGGWDSKLHADEFTEVYGTGAKLGFAKWSDFSPKGGQVAFYDKTIKGFGQYQGTHKATMGQITKGETTFQGKKYKARFDRDFNEWTFVRS